MKAYGGRGIEVTPLILNLNPGWRGVSQALYPQGRMTILIELEAVWGAPEPVWTLWNTEKSLVLSMIRIPDRPAHSLITIPTLLFQFPLWL